MGRTSFSNVSTASPPWAVIAMDKRNGSRGMNFIQGIKTTLPERRVLRPFGRKMDAGERDLRGKHCETYQRLQRSSGWSSLDPLDVVSVLNVPAKQLLMSIKQLIIIPLLLG